MITDNGKQFTDRFSRYGPNRGEVLFDKICRRNGITHLLTQPASPNQNGKVERLHGTLRPDLAELGPFTTVEQAQAAVDDWVEQYNSERPHQALDDTTPVVPADRFAPADAGEVELWLPPSLDVAPAPAADPADTPDPATDPAVGAASGRARGSGAPVELTKPVPPSGNLALCGNQFWLGPARAGQPVRFWIDCDWVHLSIGDQRVKTLRSRFSSADLDTLAAQGATPAGPPPVSTRERAETGVVEVERTVARTGTVSLGNQTLIVAEVLAGRRVGIWIEDDAPLLIFDPDTRELLRTRPNPLTPDQARRLQRRTVPGERPRPSTEPVTVQRRASNTGVIAVVRQKIALGPSWAGHIVTVHVSETTLAVDLPDGDTIVTRRTTDLPVRNIKGQRPRTATPNV